MDNLLVICALVVVFACVHTICEAATEVAKHKYSRTNIKTVTANSIVVNPQQPE